MSPRALVLTWHDKEASGYKTVLPWSLFDREVEGKVTTNEVHGPVSALEYARGYLRVRGRVAELNCIPFKRFNEAQGMCLGVLRLRFADSDRSVVTRVEWRDARAATFSQADATIETVPLRRLERPRTAPRRRATVARKEPGDRSGQAEFRRRVKLVYDHRCCLTDCDVLEALEACHVNRRRGGSSDRPQNGVLLRSDLHRLFDEDMMAFDPQTLRVFFCAEACSWPEYARLHGRAKLRLPSGRNALARPSVKALERRWRAFKQAEEASDG